MAITAPPQTQLRPLTYEDYAALPDDGNRYEVIGGELFMCPAPVTKHQIGLSELFARLRQHLMTSRQGYVFPSPIDVVFSRFTVVQPDLVVVLREHRAIIRREHIAGVPDLIVEVLSPSNRMHDLVKKAALYAERGVPEYWVLDPEAETVTVNRLDDGQHLPVAAEDGLARSVVLPGFAVNPADLFALPAWMATDAE